MNEEKEIKFLIELLRGIGTGRLDWETEKLHFFHTFKRIFGITELEKKIENNYNKLFKRLYGFHSTSGEDSELGALQEIDIQMDRIEKEMGKRIEKLESQNIGDNLDNLNSMYLNLKQEISELKQLLKKV